MSSPRQSTDQEDMETDGDNVAEAQEAPANIEVDNVEAETPYDVKLMTQVFAIWEAKNSEPGFDPVPALRRLAEIFEKKTEIYMRKDIDPFDERHPYRTDPSCQFGFLLKQLFRKEHFMNKLFNDYLRDNYFTRQNVQKSSLELNIVACRLILVIMPGLETSAVFQVEYDQLINRLYSWAEDSVEPLKCYATGLLAAAMEVTDIAAAFKETNTRILPKMLKRLYELQAIHLSGDSIKEDTTSIQATFKEDVIERNLPTWMSGSAPVSPEQIEDDVTQATKTYNDNVEVHQDNSNTSILQESSRDAASSLQKMLIRTYIPVHPPTLEASQMLILRYLTSMGAYQEFIGLVFEHKALPLICAYITNIEKRDTCLAFEALKYLASLLCHKKFALDFIAHGGLELLLKVPRPSIAATGVSITLYYLAYCEDAMERICAMPKSILSELVSYGLWLLERSYDSGKCHATMFFGLSFQFKVILDEFDAQDGLRKLYNVIAILKILNPPNNEEEEVEMPFNEDLECASRQLVRHVCLALKRYMESHLFYRYNLVMGQQCPTSTEFSVSQTKAVKPTLEQISEQIRTLQEMSIRGNWQPVDQLLKLGGIQLLLKVIALSYEWNNTGRAETLRSALDVLSICCVVPKVLLAFCDNLELPDNLLSSGMYAILGAAAGDITSDAGVQKSALAVVCHCVCAPINKNPQPASQKISGAVRKRPSYQKFSEELIEKVWESVCCNNGIIVLLQLMQIKTPITDADCIRGMACRALSGLTRFWRVRQIIGKLPLFALGTIQHLMRDPILQEKRSEHVLFQKYALELLERISGKRSNIHNALDPTLANIHKANVVAQTKIQYNEQQLIQLIYDHLVSKGLTASAQLLQKEAGLSTTKTLTKNFHQSPIDYSVHVSVPSRNRIRNRVQDMQTPAGSSSSSSTAETELTANNEGSTPIKLVRKNNITIGNTTGSNVSNVFSSPSAQKSLQKQISSSPFSTHSNEPRHSNVTLSTIVAEYLTNQHALCNNPMTTCPQFDLFVPHKCPDPEPHKVYGPILNFTTRWFRSQSGFSSTNLDRRFVHSNFATWRTIRPSDYSDVDFGSCSFLPNNNLIVVGTLQGETKAYNINDGTELFSSPGHTYAIHSIQSNRQGNLILTSCSWRSYLRSIEQNEFVNKFHLDNEFYCEFSNVNQDKILGTQTYASVIYDLETSNKISTFKPSVANQYTKNRATFSPTDELILSDGVLWDVRSGKEIHKFDKLNQSLSGVFHPGGLEIISNTEVWDLRTFHLLQTIPAIDQCLIKFSPLNVIYGISLENIEVEIDLYGPHNFDTSFKVLDSYDYSSITTVDVKKRIFDLSVNSNGSIIAVVENQPTYYSHQETFIKMYAVGMKKNDQQEEEEDEEESDEGTDSESLRVFEYGNGLRRSRRRRRDGNDADGDDEDDDEDVDDEDDDDEEDDDSDDDDEDGYGGARLVSPMWSEDEGDMDFYGNNEDNEDVDANARAGGSRLTPPAWISGVRLVSPAWSGDDSDMRFYGNNEDNEDVDADAEVGPYANTNNANGNRDDSSDSSSETLAVELNFDL